MPTIVQINPCIDRSTGSIATEIGENIVREGWNSFIAYSGYYHSKNCSSSLIRIGGKLNYLSHVILTRLFDNHGSYSFIATLFFLIKLSRVHPDIIHLHNIHGYYLNYPLLFYYLKKHNIPVIWTMHDCWPITGHCVHFESVQCSKWEHSCKSCPLKAEYPASVLLDSSAFSYRKKKSIFNQLQKLTLVPVSKWLASIVERSYLFQNDVTVINNGIDLKRFCPSESTVRDKYKINDCFVILGVATGWYEGGGRKRLDDFLKLAKILDSRFKIVLVGITDNVRHLIPSTVLALGRTSDSRELVDLYSTADVFLNPTYQDTFPTVNMEAIACGCPVITYDTGGSPETINYGKIEDGIKTGFVFKKGDVLSVASTLESLYNEDKAIRSKRRTLCRSIALNRFNKEECFQNYIALYKKILDEL